jgi:hypothetical protein
MRKWTLVTLALVALAVPVTSRAQFSLGLRLGYAKPAGEISVGDLKLDQNAFITDQIPVQLDIDYRIAFGLTVGIYGSYGRGTPSEGTDSAACTGSADDGSCQTATVYRAGAQITWSLPFPLIKPWFGAGVGYEWAKITREDAKNVGARGPERINLQFGIDVAIPYIRVGPFAQWTNGTYRRESISTDGTAVDVADTVRHGWLYYGLRVRFDP